MRRKVLALPEQTGESMLGWERTIRLHRIGNEERNMESKLVRDLLSEAFLWKDKGCDVLPSRLGCPLVIAGKKSPGAEKLPGGQAFRDDHGPGAIREGR